MIGSKDHQELIASIKSGSLENVRKILQKNKVWSKELCTRTMFIEEFSKCEHPFSGERLSALQYCAFIYPLDIFIELIRVSGKDHLKTNTSKKGWNVTHFAAYGGNIDILCYLLEQGVNPEASTKDGWRPLHLAVARGSSEVVNVLLCKGVDSSVCLPNGCTALHVCVDRYPWTGKGEDVNIDRAGIIKALAKDGVSSAKKNSAGETPLQLCLIRCTGGTGVVSALLSTPEVADTLGDVTGNGETLLHLTTGPDTAELLIQAGCKLNLQGKDGRTALHVNSGNCKMMKVLLERGANANIPDNQGRTALHVALTREELSLDVVELLISVIADINGTDKGKNTAVHLASAYQYKNITSTKFKDPLIELLIKGGVLINLQNKRGETALHLAIRSRQYTKAGMLVRAGANVDLLDVAGASPRNMDTKWVNRMLYQDPLDTRSRSDLSGRSGAMSRSPGRSPSRTPRDTLTAAIADARLGKYLTPMPSPTPSVSNRLSPSNVDQLLSSSEGIDELTLKLGFTAGDDDNNNDLAKNIQNQDGESESDTRAQLQSQISSLRDEMSSLHDILEGYAIAPSSPPSVSYTAPSIASITEKQSEAISDDELDMILEENNLYANPKQMYNR